MSRVKVQPLHQPFAVEAIGGQILRGAIVAQCRPLSPSVGFAVGRLLLDVLAARRQLGLQVPDFPQQFAHDVQSGDPGRHGERRR